MQRRQLPLLDGLDCNHLFPPWHVLEAHRNLWLLLLFQKLLLLLLLGRYVLLLALLLLYTHQLLLLLLKELVLGWQV